MQNFDVPLGIKGNISSKKHQSVKRAPVEEVVKPETSDDIASRMQLDLDKVLSPRELVNFFANHYQRVHGYPYPMDKNRDLSVARAFINRWQERAGKIIQFLFQEYDGVYLDQKQGIEIMSTGSHWVASKIYDEMMQRENGTDQESRRGEFSDADRFLGMFGD